MMLTHLLLYKSSTVGDTQHSVLIFTLSLDKQHHPYLVSSK